jgi:hypothetical protein
MLERQIELSRGIAKFILESDEYELLPRFGGSTEEILSNIYVIVLFRAKDETLNEQLVQKIKASRKVYVSGTAWNGQPACRFAVSNWQVDVSRDLPLIEEVLNEIIQQ